MAQSKKKSGVSWIRWCLLLPIPLLWCYLGYDGKLQFLENRLLDLRFKHRGELEAPVKLIYLDVDTRAIEAMGEKPWNRILFADTLNALFKAGGARVVGIDIVLSEISSSKKSKLIDQAKARSGNGALRKVMLEHPKRVVLAAQYTAGDTAVTGEGDAKREIPLLRKGKVDRSKNDVPERPDNGFILGPGSLPIGRVGLIDVDVEYSGDTVPRWVPMFVHAADQTFYHLSLQLVLEYLGLDESAVRILPEKIELVRSNGEVVSTIPLAEGQLLEANWFSHWENPKLNPRFSMADVFLAFDLVDSQDAEERREGKEFFDQFRDAIVLIGPTDTLLQDLAPSPFDAAPVPKVGLHGNLVKTIISERFLQHVPHWVTWVAALGLTLIVSALATAGSVRGLAAKAFALIALGGYTFVAFYLFSRAQIILPMAAPLGAALSTSFVAILWQLVVEEKQKGRIKGMFGTYLSPALVNRMIESGSDPQLGGHKSEITAYFSDIQGFSAFSELLDSKQLVELMNEYLTACSDIILEEGGYLDKYIGDAIVAMFGAPFPLPDHAFRACVATQRVHLKLAELRAKWQAEGAKWPQIVWRMQSRIGLNTGMATIGNMGSTKKFNYTMMGDDVNLAARMESGAKAYGVYTMVTEATKLACEQHGGDRLVFRYLDKIVVKGRSIPVPVFEVAGLKESVPPQTLECLQLFAQGMAKYLVQDWDQAEELFRRSALIEPNIPGQTPGVETNPSLVLIERCAKMRRHSPGENWDGVYHMKEK